MDKELQFLIYNTPQENVKVDVVVKDETIWLTQKAMAALFDVEISSISRHLKNIFEEREIDEKVVVAKIAITTQHGAIADKTKTKDINFYNLDAIISVGYRVNSARATQFRIWATKTLKRKGRKSKQQADQKAEAEYEVFNKTQKINSDFDKEIKKLKQKEEGNE